MPSTRPSTNLSGGASISAAGGERRRGRKAERGAASADAERGRQKPVAGMGSTAERALFEAAKHGDAPAIRKLLSNSDRLDVNAKASSGCTALHYGKHAFCTMSFIVFARECLSDCKRGRDWEGGREGGREGGKVGGRKGGRL